MRGVFAFLFNLDLSEIGIILVGAIIVFGKNLPQVAMRGAAQVVRLRRQLMQMWREAGLEEEMRKVQREVESNVPRLPPPKSFFDPPPATSPAAPAAAAGVGGLQAAHEAAERGPDEDPEEAPSWAREDPYGPREEEQRSSDYIEPALQQPDEPEPSSETPPASSDEEPPAPKGESA